MNWFRALGRGLARRGPEILLGCCFSSFITSIIFAVKATPKAMEKIKEAKAETVPEKVKACWKCYIPAMVSAAGGVACGIASLHVQKKRYAALAAAYTAVDSALARYQQKVVETVGEKKERQIQDDIVIDKIKEAEATKPAAFILDCGQDYPIMEGITGAVVMCNVNKVDRLENWLNLKMRTENYVSFPELLYELSVPQDEWKRDADYINAVGWNIKDGEVRFIKTYTNLKDGRPTFAITYSRRPEYNFDKFG